MTPTRPPILWFADMPADFHNPEPWHKIRGLRDAGHRVLFVDQLGVANPRPRNAAKMLRYARRRMARGAGARGAPGTRQLLLVPPRHHGPTDALNDRLIRRQLARLIDGLDAPPVLWFRFPTPELVRQIGRLGERLVVYDCVDRYAAFGYPRRATEALVAAERALLTRADLTLVTSEGLGRLVAPWSRRTVVHHTGVDVDLFARAHPAPADVARLPRPLLGYTGSVDEKLDYALLARVAAAHPEGSLVVVGPRAPGVDTAGLETLPNVHMLGGRPHEAMPGYVRALDVGLMPYLMSPVTEVAFPVKSLEYLAAGLGCVGTDLPELRRFQAVMAIARTHEEFLAGVEGVLRGGLAADPPRRRAAVAAHDWGERARILCGLVDELLASPA